MFKKFQWSNKLGVHNIVDLSTLFGQGINRSNSLNIYGYWYKKEDTLNQYRFILNSFLENETWTIWINENEIIKHISGFENRDRRIFIIMMEYLKLKRNLTINNILNGH
jgi:hypothetical protein